MGLSIFGTVDFYLHAYSKINDVENKNFPVTLIKTSPISKIYVTGERIRDGKMFSPQI